MRTSQVHKDPNQMNEYACFCCMSQVERSEAPRRYSAGMIAALLQKVMQSGPNPLHDCAEDKGAVVTGTRDWTVVDFENEPRLRHVYN